MLHTALVVMHIQLLAVYLAYLRTGGDGNERVVCLSEGFELVR